MPSAAPAGPVEGEAPPRVHTCFEPTTATWQYVIADPRSRAAVVVDPVLDFDPATTALRTDSADRLLALVDAERYAVSHILETHAHADHLTASSYLQRQLVARGQRRPAICIGKRITQVQATFGRLYSVPADELDGVFDKLFDDDDEFCVGALKAKVLHLPGHTPDHVGYVIGENVFTGDSIFNPDVGSARCDFPAGSANDLYRSMRTLLSLPAHYRLYTGHDYPPDSRAPAPTGERFKPYTTVAEQNDENIHVKKGVAEEKFVELRSARDASLSEPRLLHQALQFNIRAGRLPAETAEGYRFLQVPLKVPRTLL